MRLTSAGATTDFASRYARLLTRAWCEDAYDALLSSDPRTALSHVGLEIPDDAQIAVIRRGTCPPDLELQTTLWMDAADSKRYVLHVPPLDAEALALDQLDHVVGGSTLSEPRNAAPGMWQSLLRELMVTRSV
ncbi:hypothetical protein ACFU7X_03155 [Streptomyces chartreusis]|uniref:hypothetical protein n=1 Tax=Streptomyces chartreusis TaxID=1969 RepID=UPI0036B4C686